MALLSLKLHWQILIALVLAIIVGLLTGTDAGLFGVTFYSIFDFLGKLFLNALKMLIVPLIVSSSLVAIAIILAAVGLPLEGIGPILAVDRILDMMRTSVNVFSDSCGAVIIGKSQGEQGILEDRPAGP